jgi:CubicO group peptidase (beta-lactamase class C family)
MKIFISLIILTCLLKEVSAQNNQDSIINYIESSIDSMPNGFAISIAILHNGKIEYIGFIKEDEQLVLSDLKDSLFEIGSLTKVFTSTVLANKVVSGNVKLTCRVNKAFPYKFNNKIKLTYQSLANHTSGMYRLPSNIMPLLLKNQDNPYSEYSFSLFDTYLQEELQIENLDGLNYSYSNLGAGLLAYSLSQESNENFDTLLQKLVFTKYNMLTTSYKVSTSFYGLGVNGNRVGNWQFNAMRGAGGLISNTHDLSKFIIAQFSNENNELSLTRNETFSISENFSIGLGWHILNPQSEERKFWHNGGTGGFTSSISFRTANKTGVIILSNISALHKQSVVIDELCFELLDLLK